MSLHETKLIQARHNSHSKIHYFRGMTQFYIALTCTKTNDTSLCTESS